MLGVERQHGRVCLLQNLRDQNRGMKVEFENVCQSAKNGIRIGNLCKMGLMVSGFS